MQKRLKFLSVVAILLFLTVAGRLLTMQLLQRADYALAAEQTQVHEWKLRATRGLIYWRDGERQVPAVLNESVYDVFVDYAMVEQREATRQHLLELLGETAATKFDGALAAKKSRYVILADDVSRATAETVRAAELAGIGFEEGVKRVYPEGELGSRILGFVNREGQGQYGVEGAFNQLLTGKDGLRKAVTDLRNVPLTVGAEGTLVPAENGSDIRLTIDRNLQAMAEAKSQQWSANYGAEFVDIIIYNAQNGEILAMANRSGYDPANYSRYELADFANPVLADSYEPASVMKTVTMAAALNLGVLRPSDTYLNHRGVVIDGLPIRNMTDRAAGAEQTFQQAMDWSFNVGSIAMLERIGGGSITAEARQALYEFQQRLGFGVPTGVELPEASGYLRQPNEGYAVNHCYANMTFGQCESMSMLQLISAFSTIINGGTRYRPTVLLGQGGEVAADAVVSREVSREMRAVLFSAANLYQTSLQPPFTERYCGGKTGTAQVPNPAGGYYSDRQTGSYYGFCMADIESAPELVVGVRYGGAGVQGGGANAKRIWDDLMLEIMPYAEGVVY